MNSENMREFIRFIDSVGREVCRMSLWWRGTVGWFTIRKATLDFAYIRGQK